MSPSIYDNETAETLKTRIQENETRIEQYVAERSSAEKNARALRKQNDDMRTVLIRKLQAAQAAPSKK